MTDHPAPYMTAKMVNGSHLTQQIAELLREHLNLPIEDVAVLLLAQAGRILASPPCEPDALERARYAKSVLNIVLLGIEQPLKKTPISMV